MAAPTGPRAQSNGVLPISVSHITGTASKTPATKPPTPRLKVIVRRLAPGLTEPEFILILGDAWKVGQGKVDWFSYKPGKDSRDPSKPSRPSRAYLHLTSSDHLVGLAEYVRQTTFEDVQNTYTSSTLIGPPVVEFAPYSRIPSGRRRTDARAGTIDQDPELMAFLEGLANPDTSKESNHEGEDSTGKPEPVKTTPLVQYLKERKANKSKEAAVKSAKKQEVKGKGKEVISSPEDTKKKGKEAKTDKLVEKAAKEAVRILNREAAVKTAASSSNTAESPKPSSSEKPPKLDVNKIPTPQRGAAIATHIRMLRRDLGLSPAQAQRQIRRDTADAQKAEASDKTVGEKSSSTEAATSSQASTPSTPIAPQAALQSNSRRSRGKGSSYESTTSTNISSTSTTVTPAGPSTFSPVVLLKKPETPQTSPATTAATPSSPQTPATSTPQPPSGPSNASRSNRKRAPETPSGGARQAFVKHANPSQGVTEPLLKEALKKFGAVSMVEIDKRKGFAYVDFVEPEGLKLAMAANPIVVAQGTVQVMQRKGPVAPAAVTTPAKSSFKGPSASTRGGGGRGGGSIGRRGGRGGSAVRGGGNSNPSQGGGSFDGGKAPASAPSGPASK